MGEWWRLSVCAAITLTYPFAPGLFSDRSLICATDYEGAVEVRNAVTRPGRLIGYGYVEGVGWDRGQIRKTVRTALQLKDGEELSEEVLGLLSSRPPRIKPPSK